MEKTFFSDVQKKKQKVIHLKSLKFCCLIRIYYSLRTAQSLTKVSHSVFERFLVVKINGF
jgi:hypothetical protein